MPNKIVGVRFRRCCKVYDFDAGVFVLHPGDQVIVETEFGLALGEVASMPRPYEEPTEPSEDREEEPAALKKVHRLAVDDDFDQLEKNKDLEREGYKFCMERIRARDIPMNLVKVECLFDRSKIIFYFTADGRLDFRELVRDLVGRFRTRIEMRQIGVRHEAKLLGGLGSCGRELCCATFLRDFEPVSVKMAKEQNLSLNPTKISGLCGRLMCCLTYEYGTYRQHKKGLPKLGKRVTLVDGREGKVVRQNVLEREVTLWLSDGSELTLKDMEIERELGIRQPNLSEQPAKQARSGGGQRKSKEKEKEGGKPKGEGQGRRKRRRRPPRGKGSGNKS